MARLDLIYGKVLSIVAQKTREHAHCDDDCIHAKHRYIHKFETRAALQGIPDGSFLMFRDGTTVRLSNGSMLISDKEY